jgi:exosortase/archaeosortase family protein
MAGPFLIAYHQGRLSFLRELLLIGSSVVVALAMNFLRIVTLVYMTHTGGTTTAAQNHDIIGIIATTFTFGGIWLIAQLLLRNSAPTGAPTQGTQLTLPSQQQLAVTVTAVALFPWLAIQLLFPTDQAASNRKPRVTPWRIDLSTLPDRWSVRKTEPRVSERALLRFSDAAIYHLTTDTGIHAVLYHFEWQTQRMPARAFRHTPALCMPWAGWTPTALPLAVELPVANVRSPAVAHFFRRGTERVGALQLVASNGGARLQMDATSTLTRT